MKLYVNIWRLWLKNVLEQAHSRIVLLAMFWYYYTKRSASKSTRILQQSDFSSSDSDLKLLKVFRLPPKWPPSKYDGQLCPESFAMHNWKFLIWNLKRDLKRTPVTAYLIYKHLFSLLFAIFHMQTEFNFFSCKVIVHQKLSK